MMSDALTTSQARGRPFPWYCPKCRKKEVRRQTISYECARLHEGRTVTVAVPSLDVPKCGSCGELVFDYEAEAQLDRACQTQTAMAKATNARP